MLAQTITKPEILWREDFTGGFDAGKHGGESRWNLFEIGPFCPNDGVVTRTDSGIRVVSRGLHGETGEPAFTQTMPQNKVEGGLPGILDHIKWSASVNKTSSRGFPGFDVVAGRTLSIEAVMGGRTYGTAAHPFGEAVADHEADFRLGAAAMVNMDLETNVIFDFFLTNNTVYALYERAPMGRQRLGNYAAFSFGVPVASRTKDQVHRLKVTYNQEENTARWFVDDREVLQVDRVGRRIDRKYMFLDVGGDEDVVTLNQLGCGLGMFTIMDGCLNGSPGLVDLAGFPMCFDPLKGAPENLMFFDCDSRDTSRLFGQGAEVTCQAFTVAYE